MISDSKFRYVDFAINTAKKNTSNYLNSKHGAVIVKNGKFICSAPNTESFHAEINVLKQAQLKGS